MWNSVEIYNKYSEYGGLFLTRRNLIRNIVENFGNEVVLLSSPGVASILVFRKHCHFKLQNIDDSNDKNLKIIATAIRTETSSTVKTQYKVRFDIGSITEGFSERLMDLLAELKIGCLPSILVAMSHYITSYINTIFVNLW